MSIFRNYLGLKFSFENNSVRINFFLSAYNCCKDRISVREMGLKFPFGGIIGYGHSWFVFCYSEISRLHGILHDAAGAVQSHSGNGTGESYMTGRVPKSCFIGHVTGLLLSLRKTLSTFFLLATFEAMCHALYDFLGWMVNIFIKELGVSFDGNVQGKLIWSSEEVRTHGARTLVYWKYAQNCVKQW